MEQFKNILFVSCSGQEDLAAINRVNQLAMSNQARITLVRVVDELPAAAGYLILKKRLTTLHEAAQTLAQNDLDELASHIDPTLKVETRILVGKPFIEIIRAVLSHSHDLIIKPKQAVVKEPALDSTDLHLLRKCPCPVWIIKPSQRKPFGKILIAVDPDPADPQRLSLHAELIKLGTSLAKSEQGKVEVVHIWDLQGATTLRGPRFNLSDAEIVAMTNEMQATRQKQLAELLAPYAASRIKTSLVQGDPGPTLVRLIEKRKPDIVVMGTVARTG
ncbi:MAG: universal stress protein, partial [Desulfuromonadales bacterium]|nr:universal stress protein [Desulfuromonadales bacterium]